MSCAKGMSLATVAWLAFALAGFSPALLATEASAQEAAVADPDQADDETAEPLTEDELEVLVARIALYPDELVALVTSASLYPLQVVEAARYLQDVKKNTKLKPKATWDGSVVSLLNYPDIVKMMSDDLDWTQSLAEALANQQKDVLVAIQQLRDKAVADGIIKTDDKIKVVQENDNVVIQSANAEKIYVPQYPPEMLYEPDYAPEPIGYYPDSYSNYSYPNAPYFAAAVTGVLFAAAIDWNGWGVWGGRWNGGDVDIDCNNCLNNINGKVKLNDVDWKNVDRSNMKFDANQFSNIDRNSVRNNIKADGGNSIRAKANSIGNDRTANIRNKPGNISVNDVRKSKIDSDRINRERAATRDRSGGGNVAAGGARKQAQVAQNRKPAARPAGNVKSKPNANRPHAKPKPAARRDARPRNPSALGNVDSGRRTQMQSNRGRQSMSGGNRGGHRSMPSRGGGGRGGGRGGGGGGRR